RSQSASLLLQSRALEPAKARTVVARGGAVNDVAVTVRSEFAPVRSRYARALTTNRRVGDGAQGRHQGTRVRARVIGGREGPPRGFRGEMGGPLLLPKGRHAGLHDRSS